MNKQEYYDLLIKSTYDGTFPGYDTEKQICSYNDGKGHYCAIGVLTKGTNLKFPNESTVYENKDFMLSNHLVPNGLNFEQLRRIQETHDFAYPEKENSLFGEVDRTKPWDRNKFLTRLNSLVCFQDVNKHIPTPMLDTK